MAGRAWELAFHGFLTEFLEVSFSDVIKISTEAVVKISKHSWNVYPLEAFGFLVGDSSSDEILAALPCSKTSKWYEPFNRWNGLDKHLDAAKTVATHFGLEIIGVYGSIPESYSSITISNFSSIPDKILNLALIYQCECCKKCSRIFIYKHINNNFTEFSVKKSKKKRLRDKYSQKRIFHDWLKIFGPIDYNNLHDQQQGA